MPIRILSVENLRAPTQTPSDERLDRTAQLTRAAGCNGAVLSYTWPALEPSRGTYTLEKLAQEVQRSEGRYLSLDIQIINGTMKHLPNDLQQNALNDERVIRRFAGFLDGLAPLLQNRVLYLSIGNQVDLYLIEHPGELEAFKEFLEMARLHARTIAPDLIVGSTLTATGALREDMRSVVQEMDAHFITYFHTAETLVEGVEGKGVDPADTKSKILTLARQLDGRSIVIQGLGFPAHPGLGSPDGQARFVGGVFDAWDDLGDRVPFVNYSMLQDDTEEHAIEQLKVYGVGSTHVALVQFLSSLGLHDRHGTPRPGWDVLVDRAKGLAIHGLR